MQYSHIRRPFGGDAGIQHTQRSNRTHICTLYPCGAHFLAALQVPVCLGSGKHVCRCAANRIMSPISYGLLLVGRFAGITALQPNRRQMHFRASTYCIVVGAAILTILGVQRSICECRLCCFTDTNECMFSCLETRIAFATQYWTKDAF